MTSKPWVGKTVVVIDDSKRVRDELKAAFTACGAQVVGEAENGVVGIAMVRQHKPELISLDLIMPEMDGVECYRKIMAFQPDAKIIMVTWLGGEAKILENLKDLIPAHLFQTKPVNEADLTARLEKVYFPHLIKVPTPPKEEPELELPNDFDDLGVKVS